MPKFVPNVRVLAALFIAIPAVADTPEMKYDYPFRDPGLPREERITDLIGRMTLDEKVDWLGFQVNLPRLNIAGTRNSEGYHGVAQGGPSNWGKRNPTATTQFAQAYGLGAMWDPDMLQRVAANQATEVRYLVQSEKYNRSGLIVMSPNTDIARDPRWGRTEEVYGEDPFLVGTLATAFVRGLQGDDPHYLKAASLLKHFLANSNENGRFHSSSDFDDRLWREYYAKGFEMAVRDGGANAMMTAYNAINGTPAHVHPMLREIVMGEWGLDGIICTDGGGMSHLVDEHKKFDDHAEACAACIKAGINLFLDRHKEPTLEAIKRGLLSEADIDAALRGRIRVFMNLGLFDPPEMVPYSKIGHEPGPEPWDKPGTHELVREATRESIVLLKNDGLLPLDPASIKSVAVVGPLANTVLLDWYSGTPPYAISPRVGIEDFAQPRERFAPSKFSVNWVADMSDVAIEAAAKRDVAIVCIGNHPESNAGWEIVTQPSDGKEGIDRSEIDLPPETENFIRHVMEVNPRTVVVLVSNFPYAMPWAADHARAILNITHASQEQGNAIADVIFGAYNPGGKTVQTWPKSLEDLPPMMDYDIRHGRTYMYSKAEPQYPFGFGLSYTTFELSNVRGGDLLEKDGTVSVSVDVTNTGKLKGDEVVQLYARFPQSKVDRPAKALKAFKRITVGPGKTGTATMNVRAADLAYWDVDAHAWVVESGPVEFLVGNSSADSSLNLLKSIIVK